MHRVHLDPKYKVDFGQESKSAVRQKLLIATSEIKGNTGPPSMTPLVLHINLC